MAQESPGLGIFDAMADWGLENENWRIDKNGVAYFNQIVLEPQELNDLLPLEGALIFLNNPVQIGMGYDDAWHYTESNY